jgi:hypothetical protein
MGNVIRLREYRRLPGYLTPDTVRDRKLIRACGWKGATLFSEATVNILLEVVSSAGFWLSTPVLRD